MADDNRLFFKLHSGFTEHPKTVGLSDKAFRHLIELWLYCHRNMTDGIVPKGQLSRTLTAKTRRELIDAGYIFMQETDAEMHDYLKHQMSADTIETLRNKRKLAGAKGGLAKAKGLASATAKPKQNGSKPVADKDKDKDTKESGSATPPATLTPEHLAADHAYQRTGKAFNFIAVRAMAKWAIHERNESPQTVANVIVAVYESGKPITKQTIGQFLDGIAKESPRRNANAAPSPWDHHGVHDYPKDDN